MSGADLELLGDGWLEALAGACEGVKAPGAVDGVAQVVVKGAPGGRPVAFHIIVEQGGVRVIPGRRRNPDAVLGWKFADFAAVWGGELSMEEAYMDGMLKIDGDRVLLIDGWRSMRTSDEVISVLRTLGAAPG